MLGDTDVPFLCLYSPQMFLSQTFLGCETALTNSRTSHESHDVNQSAIPADMPKDMKSESFRNNQRPMYRHMQDELPACRDKDHSLFSILPGCHLLLHPPHNVESRRRQASGSSPGPAPSLLPRENTLLAMESSFKTCTTASAATRV